MHPGKRYERAQRRAYIGLMMAIGPAFGFALACWQLFDGLERPHEWWIFGVVLVGSALWWRWFVRRVIESLGAMADALDALNAIEHEKQRTDPETDLYE